MLNKIWNLVYNYILGLGLMLAVVLFISTIITKIQSRIGDMGLAVIALLILFSVPLCTIGEGVRLEISKLSHKNDKKV